MKTIQQHITERLQLNRDRVQKIKHEYFPETKKEMYDIIYKITEEHKTDKIINLNMIDTSKITDMSYLFYRSQYNYDISEWDVSNVIEMSNMFAESKFNNDISKWDVSHVTNMDCMFERSDFNNDISKWDVLHVTNMNGMFRFDKEFNQYLGDWNMSNVLNTCGMFNGCFKFTGDGLKQWNMSNVRNMSYMFKNAKNFNEDISTWKLHKHVKMRNIFSTWVDKGKITLKFNHDLTPWASQIEKDEIVNIKKYIK